MQIKLLGVSHHPPAASSACAERAEDETVTPALTSCSSY